MDLSILKWPLIILVVAGVGWLLTEGGVNYMYNSFTEGAVGEDVQKDEFNESGLYRLGGYLMMTFRYARAAEVYEASVDRYPNGENYWMAYYNLARAYEKLEKYQQAVDILGYLRNEDGDQHDERVPDVQTLTFRLETLVEMHQLTMPPMP